MGVGVTGNVAPPGALSRLFSEGLHLEARSQEQSTAAGYSGNRKRLRAFCVDVLGLPADAMFPPEPSKPTPWELLYLWITHASSSGLRPATIDNYIKTVVDWHSQKGLRSQCPDLHHRVIRLRKGVTKAAGAKAVPQRKQALSWNWFLLLIRHVRHGRSSWIRDRRCALRDVFWLVGGFLALARRSELAAFQLRDLHVSSGHISFRFRSSKTDPGGVGCTVHVSRTAVPGLDLGLLANDYLRMLQAAGVPATGPLFGWDSSPLRPYAHKGDGIVTRLRRLMVELDATHHLGLGDVKQYAGHSLRRGGAQALRDVGVPREVIMAQGRWRSSAVDVYLDVLRLEWLVDATRALAVRGWHATAAGRRR